MTRISESGDLPLDIIGEFPVDWERSTLGKACSLVTDGTHDSPKESVAGFPLVTGKCITGGRVNLNAAYLISEADHRAVVARSRPEFGDILFANIGNSIGELARVEIVAEFSIKNVALFKPSERLDSRFLKYYLLSIPVQNYIRGTTFGSAQPFIGLSSLRAFPIPLPAMHEQRAIVHILGTLDDKIELNRQMNETLEAMARALFKSWFVDFDPVRAKHALSKVEGAEGRPSTSSGQAFPGLPKPLADLFPDSFEDSELGEIPKGWRVGSVDDEFNLTMGQSPPGETYNDAGVGLPFYQGCTDFGFRFPTRRIYCTAPARIGKAGDALVSVRAPVGDINMATEDCAIGRGVAAARHKTGSRSYTYQFMQSIEEVFARFEAEGTVFGSIGKKDFHAIACVNPPRELVLAYEARVSPLDDRVEVNERESRTLAVVRDTLLPKLISGELRVNGTERLIEERIL